MRTVRIQRKRKSFAKQCTNVAGFFTLAASLMLKPYINEQKTVMEDARLEKIRTDSRVADMRAAKLSNDLVLQDMKIEAEKMKLQLLEAELKRHGIGQSFEASNYSSDRGGS